MRPLLHGDVAAAARVLLALPEAMRTPRIRRLFRESALADQHRRTSGTAHPTWGSGSLMSAANRFQKAPEPGFENADYCRCWVLVLQESIACAGRSTCC